ncbi:MAG: RdgB/HAM1 family non-canonical purine NTP pyrophosphatase [Candidatus Wallbacteria bacterium]|nr:RdgB/HAM1 family non-canonical purine NTP pyrophosphatase [Candidatus Wallbacteria bacterium]
MTIFLATKNRHKIAEIAAIFQKKKYEFQTCWDYPEFSDLEAPETGQTLEENAREKALFWVKRIRLPVISDDTGLFVSSLGGEPGVYSSRFAGLNATYQENVHLLLLKLSGIIERGAYFETVSLLCDPDGREILGRGRLPGRISSKQAGSNGFGYDPVFLPDGYQKTLAELTDAEKNSISHRYLAFMDLASRI